MFLLITERPFSHGRKSYTIEFKLSVLRRVGEPGGNKKRAAEVCGVSRQCIQDWVRDREKFEVARKDRSVSVKKRRIILPDIDSSLNRAKYPRLEAEVIAWIKELRSKGVTVSGDGIKRNARKVYTELHSDDDVEFKASMDDYPVSLHAMALVADQ
jgi:transposase-like protein